MGSPLAPNLANLFMGYNEKNWLSDHGGLDPPIFYRRYVDDIFAVFDSREGALSFLDYLNSRHPNIKFTKEENVNGVLPFLDISISNFDGYKTSVYHKPTYSGLLTNFKSFVPFDYKKRLVYTLLDRTFKINSSRVGFDLDVRTLKSYLLRNLYPSRLIDKFVEKILEKMQQKESEVEKKPEIEMGQESRYITLPYIGDYSKVAKIKINNLFKKFCKENVRVNVVFTICKVRNYFSTKDPVPACFTSNVVYSFSCTRCKSCYVGRTHTHYDTRRKQHLGTDVNSSILSHLNKSKECKEVCDFESFKILDTAKTNFELALKESMHIKWTNPILNIQKKHAILKLLI